jgi:mannose-6-phosphate isomerase-like protein (cupin superfamily)
MADLERTRLRQREPLAPDGYEQLVKAQLKLRERALHGRIVVRAREQPWEQTRMGRLRFYVARSSDTGSALHQWLVFQHDIHTHSGKHRHQGGLAIFVLEGEGYTEVDGERIDWEAGDLILLPIKPNGVEHQHFNRHADRPCRWIAFIYMPLQDETGFYLEQQEDAPEFRR